MDFGNLYSVAKKLAQEKHRNQKYGNFDFFTHLQQTENQLLKYGYTPETNEGQKLLVLVWLHDLIDHTTFSKKEIETTFGKDLAELVYLVSDSIGHSREQVIEKNLDKLKANPLAIIMKQAERLAHLEEARRRMNSLGDRKTLRSYQKDTAFKKLEPLGGNKAMWLRIHTLVNEPDFWTE